MQEMRTRLLHLSTALGVGHNEANRVVPSGLMPQLHVPTRSSHPPPPGLSAKGKYRVHS